MCYSIRDAVSTAVLIQIGQTYKEKTMDIWTLKMAFTIIAMYYAGFALYGLIRDLRKNKVALAPLVSGNKFHLKPTLLWLMKQWAMPTWFVAAGVVGALMFAFAAQDCPKLEPNCHAPDYWPMVPEAFMGIVVGIQFVWVFLAILCGIGLACKWAWIKTAPSATRLTKAVKETACHGWQRFPVRW
jgi:hypothetical protein